MAKRWVDDQALLDSLAINLTDAMSMFPKRLIKVDELVHELRMPLSHIQILALISENDLSIGKLSARLGVAKPNTTPIVDALYERGYVTRVRSDKDKRVVLVHLEPEGRQCLDRVRELISGQIAEWPVSLTKSEARQLNDSLELLIRLMESIVEKDPEA